MNDLQYTTVHGKKQYEITDVDCNEMLAKGDAAMAQCYPTPGKGFAVAVLTAQGKIYTGASYNSETYTLTMHAEAVALAHATQYGEKEIIAITGPNCHICKQLIWERSLHSGIDIMVIMQEDHVIKKVPISEMMPYPWPDERGNI